MVYKSAKWWTCSYVVEEFLASYEWMGWRILWVVVETGK
jgi:hypothetical protein